MEMTIDTIIGIVLWPLVILGIMVLAMIVSDDDGGNAENIVCCKDCKYRSNEMYDYYGNPNNKVYVCQIHDLAAKPDWFCADGERRTDDA